MHNKYRLSSLLTCLLFVVLLAACSNQSPGVARGSTGTGLPSTPAAPQTNCPAPGTVRLAVMPAMTSGTHQNIIYMSEFGGVQVMQSQGKLMRYDVTTGRTNTIVSFSRPDVVIDGEQISADGQWILFNAEGKLQLVRVDGQERQTLFCSSTILDQMRASPDLRHVAFDTLGSNGLATGIDILDLTTARLEHVLVGHYVPETWLDATRLYVAPDQNLSPQNTTTNDLYLLDIGKGQKQQAGNLTHITSFNRDCTSFEPGSDSTHLYTTSCKQVTLAGCRGGYGLQGPSTLNALPGAGGKATTIYNARSQAIIALHSVNSRTLLIYIDNSVEDFSQNGLWEINADGSVLTRLTTEAGQRCFDPEGWGEAFGPEMVSNGQSYALRKNRSLMVGSLNGGAPKTVVTPSQGVDTLHLLGMVMM